MDIETMREEAAELMAEIRPLRERLAALQHAHNSLAANIELESRRQAKVKKIPLGVSGKVKPKPIDINALAMQFTNLPAAEQAKLLAELQTQI